MTPGNQNPKSEIRNPKLGFRNSDFGFEISNPKRGADEDVNFRIADFEFWISELEVGPQAHPPAGAAGRPAYPGILAPWANPPKKERKEL
jgi:hypothetical protein